MFKQGVWTQIWTGKSSALYKTRLEWTMISPQLIACLAAGDLSAWNGFYDDYAPLLYGVIRRQVTDELADAVLENSLVNIYNRIHEFRPGDQLFFTWMFKITTEACLLAKATGGAEGKAGNRLSPHQMT